MQQPAASTWTALEAVQWLTDNIVLVTALVDCFADAVNQYSALDTVKKAAGM